MDGASRCSLLRNLSLYVSQLQAIRRLYIYYIYIYILAITPAHHGTSTWYEGSFLYTASFHRRDSLTLISRIVMHAVRCCSSQLNAWSGKPNGNKIIQNSPNHLWKLQSWGFPTRFGMFKPGISGIPDPNPSSDRHLEVQHLPQWMT